MSCFACDKGCPIVKYYYIGAEKKNGEKVQLKVTKSEYKRIVKMMQRNPGTKLILKD